MNLLPITPELVNSPLVQSSELLADVCRLTLAIYPDSGPVFPWVGYMLVEQDTVVGTCAFKTPPKDGVVEIAYFTFPDYEGHGRATHMARELVAIAVAQRINKVIAQTLPVHNVSTHILQKLQFTFAGVVQHPDDGEVWEWEYPIAFG